MMGNREKRILFYAYGAYGLGHLRRCMKLARGLTQQCEAVSILVAVNSSQARAVNAPASVQFLRLTPLYWNIFDPRSNQYQRVPAGIPVNKAFELRAAALRDALNTFRPDLIVVDHGPTGAARELIPLLEEISSRPRSTRPRLVLGLRDIYGTPEWVKTEWGKLRAHEVFPLYDRFLIFGDADITTTAQDINLDSEYPGLVEHTGYLGEQGHRDRPLPRRDPPLVLVTTGGGHDGSIVIDPFIQYLRELKSPPAFRTRMVTGPFLSRSKVKALREACAGNPAVEILGSTRRMERHILEASAAVSMLGYNATLELICARIPVLFIPRASPSGEQMLRATRLSRPAGFDWCRSGPEAVGSIGAFIDETLGGTPKPPKQTVDMGGVSRSVKLMESML